MDKAQNVALASALGSLSTEAPTTAKSISSGQRVSKVEYNSATKDLTVVISGVNLNYERGTRLDKATNLQVPNSSIKLLQVGRGNFGQNVFGVKIDGTVVRCNMALRLNLSNEQHAKDSDQIIS